MWWDAIWGHGAKRVEIHGLPRCTQQIRYAQAWPPHRTTAMGLFAFNRELVLEGATQHVERNRWDPDESDHPFDLAVLEWLRDLDYLAQEPVRLPEGWVGIEIVLLPLIESGDFEIHCLGCKRKYLPSTLILVPETHRFGSFHRIWDCPEGHRLIKIEYMHTCG